MGFEWLPDKECRASAAARSAMKVVGAASVARRRGAVLGVAVAGSRMVREGGRIGRPLGLKTKHGPSDLNNPPPTMFPGMELLTRGVKSCRGIRSSPTDTCPDPFSPRVRTLPMCTVGDTSLPEMKSYGPAALAQLAITHPLPPSGGTRDPGVPGRGTKAIATVDLQI